MRDFDGRSTRAPIANRKIEFPSKPNHTGIPLDSICLDWNGYLKVCPSSSRCLLLVAESNVSPRSSLRLVIRGFSNLTVVAREDNNTNDFAVWDSNASPISSASKRFATIIVIDVLGSRQIKRASVVSFLPDCAKDLSRRIVRQADHQFARYCANELRKKEAAYVTADLFSIDRDSRFWRGWRAIISSLLRTV